MILTLAIILIVLVVALWISAMLIWWRSEQEKHIKTIKRSDVIHSWNKAVRLARRSWYGGVRYSKQVAVWSNKKATNTFVILFPKSKSAFVKKDILTGLEHGASSYYLASLSKPVPVKTLRVPQGKSPRTRAVARIKKVTEKDLSEE